LAGANLFVSAEQLREAVASGAFAWYALGLIFGQMYKRLIFGDGQSGLAGAKGFGCAREYPRIVRLSSRGFLSRMSLSGKDKPVSDLGSLDSLK
jgi:hypothetical protein